MKKEDITVYYGKRDKFYYIEIADIATLRDNRISQLFDEEVTISYYSNTTKDSIKNSFDTPYIYQAKFWKDKKSAEYVANRHKSPNIKEMDRIEFISAIPDEVDNQTADYKRNLLMKKQEIRYDNKWKELRSRYKAISAYIKVTDPYNWEPCNQCGLIPLVWEFNNGRSTACGCGKDEYNHFSIQSESIMSYVKRNNGSALGYTPTELRTNWNNWVLRGIDSFKIQKEKNPDIW
jgi:hypothetical protein